MNRLVIDSVKINDVNSQNIPIKTFAPGLNIICGANEAGKSTIMKFIRNCLFNPKDMDGEISFTCGETVYQVKTEGKKARRSDRIKLISPQDSTVENVLQKINQNFFRKAFTINLDDINNLDEDLFKLVQDFNVPKINAYKSNLQKELFKSITETTFKPNKCVLENIKNIKSIEGEIQELSKLEDEYSKTLSNINNISRLIEETKTLLENKKQIKVTEKYKEELGAINAEFSKLNASFNNSLSENKPKFYELAQKTGLITNYLKELEILAESKTSTNIENSALKIQSDYKLNLKGHIFDIDLSKEYEMTLRALNESRGLKTITLQSSKEQKAKLLLDLEGLSKDIEKLQAELQEIGIEDKKIHSQALNELRAAILDINEVPRVSPGKNVCVVVLVIALALIVYGIYLHNVSGMLLSAVGGVLVALAVIFNLKKPPIVSNKIHDLIKDEILLKLNYKGAFLPTNSLLNNILSSEESKLREYEILDRELKKKIASKEKLELDIKTLNQSLADNEAELKAIFLKLNEHSTILGEKISIELIFEFINSARDLKALEMLRIDEENRKSQLESEVTRFVSQFEEFLVTSNMDSAFNRNFMQKKVDEVQLAIEENEKIKLQINNLEARKVELEKLLTVTVEDYAPEKSAESLEKELEDLNERRGELNEAKRGLESFEGLIDLRNRKNIEEKKLQSMIKNAYQKLLTFNIIEHAQELQRAQEPNLISAESLLTQIAAGKYTGIDFASETVTSNNGEIKHISELSRGTKELVYLAFRLGYAQNYGADGKNYRLPLIIDDAFVNFDKERLINTFAALKEFAKTNQVLFFTCHTDYVMSIVGDDASFVNV